MLKWGHFGVFRRINNFICSLYKHSNASEFKEINRERRREEPRKQAPVQQSRCLVPAQRHISQSKP